MVQRRYGPTLAPGVVVVEAEGDKQLSPSAFGWAGYAGIVEKGPVGELIECQNAAAFRKKCGSYIDDSLLPDSAFSYYRLANGSGGLLISRVTDGNEVQAEMTLYARIDGAILTPMGKIKAHNGGRWGGKESVFAGDVADVADITETTITTGITTWKTDQWLGGTVQLKGVPNKSYPIAGNTSAGVITVASDQTMDTDLGVSAETRYYLTLENENKAISVLVEDGEEKPDTEFALSVFVDGDFVKKYSNLSTDPNSSRYWVSVINNDDSNYEIEVVDLWTGAHVAGVRPANHYGIVDSITETVLTAKIHDFTVTVSPTGADPTLALGSTDNTMIAQKLTIVMTSATDASVTSDKFGSLPTLTEGAAYDPENKFVPPFTITNGATVLAIGDTIVINYKPFKEDSLIGGYVYPDKKNSKLEKYRIVDNDHKTITASDGSDMTVSGAADDEFMVTAALELSGGIDGNADITDSDYTQQAWDTENSPFNRVFGLGFGVLKLATPGVTSTSVEKAGAAYAEAKNHQYRYEIPSNITTEAGAISQINDVLGRNDFAVVAFPSFGYVADPLGNGEGKRKLVSLTGMIHGREARIAASYNGYHKAAAGQQATLPELLALTTGETLLNEEQLNPVGIATIKKSVGNYTIWGDRTLSIDPTWKWKHQREQMSWYEHVLQQGFDWIIFEINDKKLWRRARTSLTAFFLPEWQTKGAIRGDSFQEAAIIKIDAENNTDVTASIGELNASIALKLSDTVERFVITIGKQGIFSSAG